MGLNLECIATNSTQGAGKNWLISMKLFSIEKYFGNRKYEGDENKEKPEQTGS